MTKVELSIDNKIRESARTDKIFALIYGVCVGIIVLFVKYELLVLVTWVMVYLFSCFIIYLSQGKLRIFTPTSLFFVFYSVVLVPGSLIVSSRTGDLRLAGIVTGGLFFYSLGVLLSTILSNFRPRREFLSFTKTEWKDSWHTPGFYIILWILILFSLFLAFVYFWQFGIPFLSSNVEQARLTAISSSSYLFPGFRLLLLFVLIIVMIKSEIYNSKWRFLELMLLSVTFTIFLATAFRAPIAALIITFLLTRQFCRGSLSLRMLMVLSIIFIMIFGFVTWRRYTHGFVDRTFWDIPRFVLKAIQHRILLSNVSNLQFILDFFPKKHGYLHGGSYLMDLKAIAPGPDIAFGGWLTMHKNPELAGIVGMTQTIIGECYANFGALGVVLCMFWFGVTVQSLFVWFVRSRKKLSSTVLIIFLTVNLAWTVMRGLGNFAFSKLVPILIVFTLLELSAWLRPISD